MKKSKRHINDDLFIRTLTFFKNNLEEGIRPADLIKHLNEKYGYDFRGIQNHPQLLTIFRFAINQQSVKNDIFYTFSGEAYFKLLEYQELSFARKNAREARILSIIAIIIAVIAGFLPYFNKL